MRFNRLFQRFFPDSQTRATRCRGQQRPAGTGRVRGRTMQVESLDERRVLAVLYVANDSGFTDAAHPGNPQAGDTVTWPGGGQAAPVANLTFGTNAFDNIEAAITAAAPGDTVDVAAGTYTEDDVVIDKSLTLQAVPNSGTTLQAPTADSGTGITIKGNPQTVTIADINILEFHSSIQDSGGGTLNLTDLTLNGFYSGQGAPNSGPVSSVSNVSNLNLTSSGPLHLIDILQGPAAQNHTNSDGTVQFFGGVGEVIAITNVSQLSANTVSGEDTFNVTPLPTTTISINGNPLPGTPGDTLNMNLIGTTGAKLMISDDPPGFSGIWTFTNAQPVNFTHIETVTPSIVSASGSGQTITATEGVSTGSQVVATFTDPANLPSADYSAEINWGDGTTSAGTVAFNATSGVYSVIGSHTYAEDGSDQVAVTVHRTGAPDATLNATATVVEPPLVPLFPPVAAPLGHERDPLIVNVGYFTHGSNTEPASDFTATIDWGDGFTTSSEVSPSGSNFVVSGLHIYRDEGTYAVKAIVTDMSGGVSLSFGTTVTIREPLLPDGSEGTPDQQFISELYGDLLYRQVDADGLAYWSARLDAGATRAQVVAGIENTDEYRHGEIEGLFQGYLDRRPEAAALAIFNAFLKNGGTYEQAAAIIEGSDEYFATRGGGTNNGFLNALFQDVLHRPIDEQAKTSFEADLANGATRAQIAAVVFASSEYHADQVDNLYLQVLDRPADADGLAYWSDQLAHGSTDEQVLQGIMSSDEYYAKTG